MTTPRKSPAIQLYDYQKAWLMDRARFRHARWSRQTGKSFVGTLGPVDDCNSRKTDWLFLSRGERQSKKLIAEAKKHARAYRVATEEIEGIYEGDDKDYKILELRFPNGSSISGLPANPDTARGWSANVLLDEFAFHKDSRAIWTALYPTITRGYRLDVLSTPNGKNNKFYELESNPRFSKHVVDIYAAVAGGLDLRGEDGQVITPDELIEAMGDEEAAAQEYLVQYLDEATAYLTYDLITECEDPEIDSVPGWADILQEQAKTAYEYMRASNESGAQALATSAQETVASLHYNNELFAGMDVGRKRDLTVIWIDEKIGRLTKTVAVIELRRAPFYQQEFIIKAILSIPQLRRFCGDQSGLGMQLMESAALRYSHKVEGVDFTSANKEELATKLKTSLEDHRRIIPAEPTIRNSLHSVRRYSTATGHFRFDAERTDEIGHADHFWAAALAELAASGPTGKPSYEGFPDSQRAAAFAQEGTW